MTEHDETCQAACWIDGRGTECDLPPGHKGKHWDQIEGREW